LLIAGLGPINTIEISADADEKAALEALESAFTRGNAVIFTLSYDLGLKLLGIPSRHHSVEPLVFAAEFESVFVHNYLQNVSMVVGKDEKSILKTTDPIPESSAPPVVVRSDFSRSEYIAAIKDIQERIRDGLTYQTNLTQKLTAELPDELTPEMIFHKLRREHPAPFSAFLRRNGSTVISASPERFFSISAENGRRTIRTSPIKGTRPRGATPDEDVRLRNELLGSAKDRAENTMIVDLLRNDIGRICEFGSVRVERLCEIEEHPTYFNLVSTIAGELRKSVSISDILRAVFPCGSITGAPKISTIRIIDDIERGPRGLSMGAIGYFIPESFGISERLDLSVAIRTMTVRGRHAEFNVGGGITIESDPASEYDETLVKATALLSAIHGKLALP
jgi:aminodeoxychorismate synthase component I